MALTSNILHEFLDNLAKWIPDLGAGILLFILFWITANISKAILSNIAKRFDHERSQVIDLLASFCKYAIIFIGLITALGSIGINVTALVASLGLSGFALGFALKDALSNLLAGIMILIYQPFKIGDKIIVAGHEGKVDHLSLRYVKLKTDDRILLIPNSSMLTNSITILKP